MQAQLFLSVDQFTVKTTGLLPIEYYRQGHNSCFRKVAIYNETTYGVIWVKNQVSLGDGETVTGKIKSEE